MEAAIIDRGRGPEIAGTRITVFDVLDYAKSGHHHTYIAAMLSVSSDQVLAAMRYVDEHKDEVMAEYQKMLDRDAQGNSPEVEAKLVVSRAKLQAALKSRRETQNGDSADARHSGGQ